MISIENLLYCLSAIPYAKPPTGSLRFRKPEPLEKALPGIFDATSAGNACPQFNQGFLLGDEDCLTVTVYVPETKVVSYNFELTKSHISMFSSMPVGVGISFLLELEFNFCFNWQSTNQIVNPWKSFCWIIMN